MPKFEGVCIEEVDLCFGTDDYSDYNITMQKTCEEQGCYTCKDVCPLYISYIRPKVILALSFSDMSPKEAVLQHEQPTRSTNNWH